MYYQKLKKKLSLIRRTPFHPQWFAYLHETLLFRSIGEHTQGVILDIGCADQYIKHYIPVNQDYIGLDYYQTATQWYKTSPHVFAEAQSLPFVDNSIDTVLFLDVMEHLPFPEGALTEIYRVLKPQGQCILQVPFLYPVHDAPLDFQRWTRYGLTTLIDRQGFKLIDLKPKGKPLETAALLLNIGLTKSVINWVKQKHPALLLGLLLPLFILLVNIGAWALSYLSKDDDLMPHSYRLVLEKPE